MRQPSERGRYACPYASVKEKAVRGAFLAATYLWQNLGMSFGRADWKAAEADRRTFLGLGAGGD